MNQLFGKKITLLAMFLLFGLSIIYYLSNNGARTTSIVSNHNVDSSMPDDANSPKNYLVNIGTVEREQDLRYFSIDGPLFFHNPKMYIIFNFSLPEATTTLDLYPNLGIYWLNSEGQKHNISFSRADNDSQIIITLQDAPPKDLIVELTPDYEDVLSLHYTITYQEYFGYTITSSDPLLDRSKHLAQFDYLNQFLYHVQYQQPYEYDISFTDLVDKRSLEAKLKEIFTGAEWKIRWINDIDCVLKVTFLEEDMEHRIRFNLSGVQNRNGYEIIESKSIWFRPTQIKRYKVLEKDGTEAELFATLLEYKGFQVSPNQRWSLVREISDSDLPVEYYSILDLANQGQMVRHFEPGEMILPQWLPDGDSFVFTKDDSLYHFDIPTGQKRLIYEFPGTSEEERFSWHRVYVEPRNGRIIVTSMTSDNSEYVFSYSADYYIFSSFEDKNPVIIPQVQKGLCELMHCYSPILFIDDQYILFRTTDNPDKNQERINFEYRFMNLKSQKYQSIQVDGYVIGTFGEGKLLIAQEHRTDNFFGYKYMVYDLYSKKMKHLLESEVILIPYHHGEVQELYRKSENEILVQASSGEWFSLHIETGELHRLKGEYVDQVNQTLYFINKR